MQGHPLDIPKPVTIDVALVNAPAPHLLEAQWRQLETQAEGSFFTSWSWIGCWLKGLAPNTKPMLLRATRNDQVVGLALVVHRRNRRLTVFPSSSLTLHATGNPDEDAITIEHNGFLIHHADSDGITASMYQHLLRRTADWDEVVLPGLPARPKLGMPLASDLVLRERTKSSYVVDLQAVRGRDGDYVSILSSNTRNQIRRSIKTYEKLGPLQLTEAKDVPTAMAFLAELKVLHEKRWAALGKVGAFSNPTFESFHVRLVEAAFPSGAVQLLRVQAGPHVVGYLYNFVFRGRVHFYQSGFDYDLVQNNSRPGIVTHTLSVGHNARLGHRIYDFMAGDTQYKRSLSTNEETMVWVNVHRKTAAFWLENSLRFIKRRVFKTPIPAQAADPAAFTAASITLAGS
jgi:CelD/BcsL family acetyltransferase involved in cellulose biosynthesis